MVLVSELLVAAGWFLPVNFLLSGSSSGANGRRASMRTMVVSGVVPAIFDVRYASLNLR